MKKILGFFSIISFIFFLFVGNAFADVMEPSLLEKTADLISNPFIAAIILAVGFTGILKEMMITEKKYIGGTVAFISFGSFFGIKLLSHQISPIDIALIILGVLLIIVEIFFIPGLGLPGIIGTIMAFIGIVRCSRSIDEALQLGCLVFLFVFAFTFALIKFMGVKLKIHGWSISSETEYTSDGSIEEEHPQPELTIDLIGITTTDLKPGGKAKFKVLEEEVISDVVAQKNAFIEINKKVQIVDNSGNRIVVKEIIEEEK